MRPALSLALIVTLWGHLGGVAWAEAPAGEDAGALLALACAGCHRDEPGGPDRIPSLAALSAGEIGEKLLAYRSGELEGTLMNRLARGYTEQQIRQLATTLGTAPE